MLWHIWNTIIQRNIVCNTWHKVRVLVRLHNPWRSSSIFHELFNLISYLKSCCSLFPPQMQIGKSFVALIFWTHFSSSTEPCRTDRDPTWSTGGNTRTYYRHLSVLLWGMWLRSSVLRSMWQGGQKKAPKTKENRWPGMHFLIDHDIYWIVYFKCICNILRWG